jgi:hypothetical protein
MQRHFILVGDFQDAILIVNENDLAGFVGAALVTCRVARRLADTLRVTQPACHCGRFAGVSGLDGDRQGQYRYEQTSHSLHIYLHAPVKNRQGVVNESFLC